MKKSAKKLALKKSVIFHLGAAEQGYIMGGIVSVDVVYATTPQAPPRTTSKRVTDCDCTMTCPIVSHCGDYSAIQCPTAPPR